ncbi:MAG: mechanosensitive ion channel family protein [Candidatus Omnitrophica bacterium]|nr:mechanosensitive ion channel family protein [Candidatus Omnitrophota bacterium]MBU1047187.1 mechanosensitive ion channel family protein [Candidatus Omnitrophota bacterium]MBU1630259.1 mechanosensitive ion channel family protein [Candidatus Omnitrophota bacterium]MBU1766838.1 mechanosensitive ion channel family protein [Candidatus Omnitrophota bacterium]MBU1889487.1 mechanosensitive ion channel family protein [Candidatus Omnitrophota bacterium]
MYSEVLKYVFWGNSILDYMMAGIILVGGFILIKIGLCYFIKRLKNFAGKTPSKIGEFFSSGVEKIGIPFLYLLIVYLSVKTLTFGPDMERGLNYFGLAIALIFSARLVIILIGYGLKMYFSKSGDDTTLERSIKGLLIITKILVWTGAIVFFLDNLGIKITAVIAGLGIGGIAIALAGQAILKDLFSYFSIIFDHPFKVGDFIIIDDYLGTIEYIGIKTTRIRSLGGEMLIFSNSDLTDSRLRNYKLMEKRRVAFRLGVVYQTSLEKLKEIPKIIENTIKNVKDTVFDRAHFFSYGDFSLIFEVVYYVVGPEYNKYMDIQQEINFCLKEEFGKKGIEFAYPTQTLYINKSAS